jgi:hypothetical protein
MTGRDFMLQPFPGTGSIPGQTLSGTVTRQAEQLAVTYVLTDPNKDILLPEQSDIPIRRIGLWEETCFEFFLAEKHSPRYWEFNLSPDGNWNVYRFEAYRQGLMEEKAVSVLPFEIRKEGRRFLLFLEFNGKVFFRVQASLELAVCAVLKTREGEKSYWAVTHPGSRPDFHHRDGFVIKL